MKRFITKRLLSLTNSLRSPHCFSQLAQNQTPLPENEVPVPKLPQFDYSPPPYVGPPADEILAKRKEYLSPSLFHFFNEPLNVVDGKMQYLFDENGRRYLDGFRGIATVCCGHCHPDVVDAIVKQINRIQHSTVLYLNHAIADFAEALASKMPGNLKVVFLTNSRTEANELALMIGRLYTGCQDIISLTNAYHGNAAATMGATAQSIWKFNVIQSGIHHALNPDPHRGVFGSDGEKYAKDVQDVIDFGTTGHVAGFISEVIQGVGGIIELPPGYLPAAYGRFNKAGGLCITDEVQAGFGRTGSHFWGFETQGVVPDIVTMAKGIGNGIPLGAVVTTPEIAEVLTRRSYFNTFGGNPLCAAAGLAVLKVVEKENLQENALAGGSYLKKRLTELQDKYESLQEEEKKKTHGDANELVSDGGFEMPEKNAFGQSFRDYNNADSERQEIVKRTYRLQHINQTYDFVKKMREEYGKLDKAKMSIWECCELLNDVVDDSDPDLDEPQIMHLLQSAEAIRKDYPDEDWLHLTALIHDLGKILLLPQFGQLPQWAVVGDIFPVGCAFDESNVHYKYFEENPDYNNPNYNTKNGVYPQGCGLNNVLMSFGHDDYMYLVAKENGPTLPSAALFIIRYHSLYPLHKCGAYEHLMNEEDKENLKWLKIFNKYDLYSKSKVPIDVEDVKPYYLSLGEKYFPAKLRW